MYVNKSTALFAFLLDHCYGVTGKKPTPFQKLMHSLNLGKWEMADVDT